MANPSLPYRIVRFLFRVAFKTMMKIDAEGLERAPQEGPLLITANHTSLFEAPLVFSIVPRAPMSVFAKKEWENTLIGKIISVANPIYVTRGEVDRQALREILKRLKEGVAIGIAPEGTRSTTGKLIEAKEGTAYIALQSGATILPVAVWGHEDAISEWKRLRRPHVFVRVGEPYKLEKDPALSRQETLEAGTRQIMHAIAQLLPREYRGFYANDALTVEE